ncbi:MAG: SDR family oxidoreductase [Chloroflexi bacterium]|nr:SDR family oxidoreductase [Chloroflexota bacterium]
MRILFIGGTGVISSACSQLAVDRGMDLTVLNRGQTSDRPLPPAVRPLVADIRRPETVKRALGDERFDAVVDWIAYTPGQIETSIDLFRQRTDQFIFISTASAYQKPPRNLPITESTPLYNPYWDYSQAKIACEDRLTRAYRDEDFPVTIVRPSHTYDRTKIPLRGGYTTIARMRQGKKVFVHGDGTSLWVLTHHTDFAKGLVGLLGNPRAIGEAFHITSDEWLTWDQIYRIMAQAAGVVPQIVHLPSEFINAFDPETGAGLLGDKAHCAIFDNSKIKRVVPDFVATVPFSVGAREIIAWYDADPDRRIVDEAFDRLTDRMISAYESIWLDTF